METKTKFQENIQVQDFLGTAENYLPSRTSQNASRNQKIEGNNQGNELNGVHNEQLNIMLLMKFNAWYGQLWACRTPDEESLKFVLSEWTDAIAGLPLESVKKAIKNVFKPYGKFSKYPPTLHEFIELCYPTRDELGIPSDAEAYQQMLQYCSGFIARDAINTIVFRAISSIGAYNLGMMAPLDNRKTFLNVYQQLVAEEIKSHCDYGTKIQSKMELGRD